MWDTSMTENILRSQTTGTASAASLILVSTLSLIDWLSRRAELSNAVLEEKEMEVKRSTDRTLRFLYAVKFLNCSRAQQKPPRDAFDVEGDS